MSQRATTPAVTALSLELYNVMSPWHPNDVEQGTFEESVWAASPEDAERELAARMAMSSGGCGEGESTEEWIADHLNACQHLMVTTRVIDSIESTILQLLAGPGGEATPDVKADLAEIMGVLSKRSALSPTPPAHNPLRTLMKRHT